MLYIEAMRKKNHQINTVLQKEVSHFSNLANHWWDPKGAFGVLHKINPIRTEFVLNQVCNHFGCERQNEFPLKGIRMLDIGCGGGLLSEPLHQLGADITGIDASPENIEVAKNHAAKKGMDIKYINMLPEELLLNSPEFDVVLNMEIVEHVSNLRLFLETSCALTKPGGAMALSTINRSLKSLLLAKFGAEYILRWVPRGTHNWYKFVKPSELACKLTQNGMDLKAIEGLSFDVPSGEWQSTKDVSTNYLVFAVKG